MDDFDKFVLLQSIKLHNSVESIKKDSINLKNSSTATAHFAIQTDNFTFKNDIIKAQNELIKNLIDIHISDQEELMNVVTLTYEAIIDLKKRLEDSGIDF